MKTIFVLNDNSAEAENAYKLALLIAHNTEAEILIANVYQPDIVPKKIRLKEINGILIGQDQFEIDYGHEMAGPNLPGGFMPVIKEVDFYGIKESCIAEEINRQNIWLIIKGMNFVFPNDNSTILNINSLLNKVICPVLLVPVNWKAKNIERIVYVSDLRYCRIEIIRYLAELGKFFNADISVTHLSAKGLPHMDDEYALSVFRDEIYNNVHYNRLFFNNTKERNITKAVDVMINGLHNDLLALVNHRFHFEEIFGRYINEILPGHITVPLLVFPY
jgi:hypothetical protein